MSTSESSRVRHSEVLRTEAVRAACSRLPLCLDTHCGSCGGDGAGCSGLRWTGYARSTGDVRACMARVQRLRYGEEANIDGFLKVKPSSSGLGIGSSNWVLKGPSRSFAYIGSSATKKNHAMALDTAALRGSQVLLFSHWDAAESLQDASSEVGRLEALLPSESLSADVKAVDMANNELYQATGGGGAAAAPKLSAQQRMSPSPSSSVSPVPTGYNSSVVHKLSSLVLLQTPPEKAGGKSVSEENEGTGQSGSMVTDERIHLICKAATEALGGGGSVLIPMHFYGMFLELLEELSSHLKSVGFE